MIFKLMRASLYHFPPDSRTFCVRAALSRDEAYERREIRVARVELRVARALRRADSRDVVCRFTSNIVSKWSARPSEKKKGRSGTLYRLRVGVQHVQAQTLLSRRCQSSLKISTATKLKI
jgi:hypothetical protein